MHLNYLRKLVILIGFLKFTCSLIKRFCSLQKASGVVSRSSLSTGCTGWTVLAPRERESEREMRRRRRRVDEQQNVLSAYYMPARISGLSEDRPPFVIKQRTNPVMEQRWSH